MVLSEGELQQLAAALGRQRGGGASGIFPFLLGCLLTAACLLAVYLNYLQQKWQRQRLMSAAELAGADSARLERLLGDALPAWVACPDSSRVEWMNAVTDQMWPHIERAATKMVMQDNFLENLLNSTTFWRPRVLYGAHIKVQAVVLGQVPPRITGVKTFPKQTGPVDEILMEYNFTWSSKMEVRLIIQLLSKSINGKGLRSLLSNASRVKIGVSDLVARGTLRASIKPLIDELPVAGGIKVSFMGAPEFSYKTAALGGNPYLVPGVQLWIDSFIRDNVLRPFAYPDGFVYNLTTGSISTFEKPAGMLEVTVVEATGVPRMDLLGKADPYVQLWLRESRKLHTTTKSRTLSPVWDESMTFLVHSAQHQELTMLIYDSDLWRPDDLIGRISLPLSSLDLTPGAVNDLWLPVPRSGKRTYGEHTSDSVGSNMDELGRVTAERARTPSSGGSGGRAGSGSGHHSVVAREDTATGFFGGSTARRRPTAAGPATGAAAGAGGAAAGAGGVAGPTLLPHAVEPSGHSSESLQHTSPGLKAMQQLKQLASNPLRPKGCQLHITATYFPLTEHEIAAVAREAGRQQRGDAMTRTDSMLGSARIADMLRSGVLYVYLDRASNLSSKVQQGFTRNMKVKVKVGGIKKTTERGKVSIQHRSNPVFDETVEVIVDGATAQQQDLMVHVEIWVQHFVLKDTFKGRVSIPLRQVIERRRLRDTWALQDASQGTITMELSWMGALAL